jgi:hypothetical protein
MFLFYVFQYYYPFYALVFQVVSFLQVVRLEFICFYLLLHLCCIHSLSHSSLFAHSSKYFRQDFVYFGDIETRSYVKILTYVLKHI